MTAARARPSVPADDELPAVPLPMFRQPPGATDPELPAVPRPEPTSPPPDPTSPPPGPGGEPEVPRPDPMPDPPARTGTFSAGRRGGAGNPEQAGRVLVGMLAVVLSTLGLVLRRRGAHLRQPTPRQLDDIARPVGRILVRYLPLDVVGPTLVDATEAAAATHAYALDGPLLTAVPLADELDEHEETAA